MEYVLPCHRAFGVLAFGRSSSLLQSTWAKLDQQLTNCRTHIYTAQAKALSGNDNDQMHESAISHRFQLRAEAIDLAARCTHAAVIVSKGAANLLDHPAQRVYREALAFSVFGQTNAVMDASLSRLAQFAHK